MGTAYGISNCIGWYRAGAGVFSDAGATPANSGDSVYQWNDQSGSANHLTQTDASSRPVYNTYDATLTSSGADTMAQYGGASQAYQPTGTPALLFDGETTRLDMPSGISLTSTGCTVLMCTRGAYYAPISFGTDGTNSINYGWVTPQQMAIRNHGLQKFPAATFLPALAPLVHGFRCSGSLNQTRMFMGMNQTSDLAQNWCNFSMTGGAIGQTLHASDPHMGDFFFLGEIYEIVIYSTPLSDSQVRTVLANLHASNRLRLDANSQQVIFIGDSSTTGAESGPFTHSYPWALCQQYGGNLKPLVVAEDGAGIANQQTNVTNFVLGLDRGSFTANVAIVCCGSDDILGGRTAAQIITDLSALCSGLRSAGFKVIITTLPARDAESGYTTANIATLASVNASIRSGYSAYANALADWAADPRLSDCTDTTYFLDGRNTTDAGDGVKATIVKAALDPLLAPPPMVTLAFATFYSPGESFNGQFGNFVRS
jgi:hypothetical protein